MSAESVTKLNFPRAFGFETDQCHYYENRAQRWLFNAVRILSYIPIIGVVGALINAHCAKRASETYLAKNLVRGRLTEIVKEIGALNIELDKLKTEGDLIEMPNRWTKFGTDAKGRAEQEAHQEVINEKLQPLNAASLQIEHKIDALKSQSQVLLLKLQSEFDANRPYSTSRDVAAETNYNTQIQEKLANLSRPFSEERCSLKSMIVGFMSIKADWEATCFKPIASDRVVAVRGMAEGIRSVIPS